MTRDGLSVERRQKVLNSTNDSIKRKKTETLKTPKPQATFKTNEMSDVQRQEFLTKLKDRGDGERKMPWASEPIRISHLVEDKQKPKLLDKLGALNYDQVNELDSL